MFTELLLVLCKGVWCVLWIGLVLMGASGEKPEIYAPYFFGVAGGLAVVHLLLWIFLQFERYFQ